jgi:hypothetical protein
MAKQSGLGDNFYVGGFDVSGDTNSLGAIGGSIATIEVTGINKSAYERIGGLRDGHIEWVSYFNDGTGIDGTHTWLASMPTADRQLMYFRGTTLGGPVAAMVAKQLNYDPTRDADGKLTIAVTAEANGYGLEWGQSLTAGKRTDTAATLGTGIDTVASAAFGGQAYLQIFSFTGTDVTVKIQDSADNVTFADVTSFAFAQNTSTLPSAQRIAIGNTATLRRYIRATTVTTGGFTSCTFAVMVVKNEILGQVF